MRGPERIGIIWSPPALDDLVAVRTFLDAHNPAAAVRLVQRIVLLVETQLPAHPESGRPGRVAGTRELVVTRTPFIVAYRLRRGAVEVIRVLHHARRWPDAL